MLISALIVVGSILGQWILLFLVDEAMVFGMRYLFKGNTSHTSMSFCRNQALTLILVSGGAIGCAALVKNFSLMSNTHLVAISVNVAGTILVGQGVSYSSSTSNYD